MLSPREPAAARRLVYRWARNKPGDMGHTYVSACFLKPANKRQTLYSGPNAIAFFLTAEVMVVNSRVFSANTSRHQQAARGAAWGRVVLEIPYARPTDTVRELMQRCVTQAAKMPDAAGRWAKYLDVLKTVAGTPPRAPRTIQLPLD